MMDINDDFFQAVEKGDLAKVKAAIEAGQPINADFCNGLTALHLAVARDQLQVAQYLDEQGAEFKPDGWGRWPTVIAAIMEVSGEMCDWVVEAECKWALPEGPELA